MGEGNPVGKVIDWGRGISHIVVFAGHAPNGGVDVLVSFHHGLISQVESDC